MVNFYSRCIRKEKGQDERASERKGSSKLKEICECGMLAALCTELSNSTVCYLTIEYLQDISESDH